MDTDVAYRNKETEEWLTVEVELDGECSKATFLYGWTPLLDNAKINPEIVPESIDNRCDVVEVEVTKIITLIGD